MNITLLLLIGLLVAAAVMSLAAIGFVVTVLAKRRKNKIAEQTEPEQTDV